MYSPDGQPDHLSALSDKWSEAGGLYSHYYYYYGYYVPRSWGPLGRDWVQRLARMHYWRGHRYYNNQ